MFLMAAELPVTTANPAEGLRALSATTLNEHNRRLLEQAVLTAGGAPPWQRRKRAEARDLLALSQLASRLTVQLLDLREALRALLLLRVPVPCLPDANARLQVAPQAALALT